MSKTHEPRYPQQSRTTPPVLPQWERQRHHRLQLDQRVRAVRRTLLTGGVVGTVAFSLIAAYQTRDASSANDDQAAVLTDSMNQLPGTNFFADQSSSSLDSVTSSATATSTARATATSTATATATTTPSLHATSTPVTVRATDDEDDSDESEDEDDEEEGERASVDVAATETANAEATATKSAKVAAARTAKADISAARADQAVPTETPTPVEETPPQPPVRTQTKSHSS